MIFIPFDAYAGVTGGPGSFMRSLQRYLDREQFPYTLDPAAGSAAFFPVTYDLDVLRRYRAAGHPILQRLDGVYYRQRNGWSYLRKNRPIKRVYRSFASFHVFQSDYSRRQCFTMFGEKPVSTHTKIVNGVDCSVFHPAAGSREPGRPWRMISTGVFRHLDMVELIVDALDRLQGAHDIQLTLVGPLSAAAEAAARRPYVQLLGRRDAQGVAEALRAADIYIFCSLNPACPNALLEAVASGLPVVSFSDGAAPELLDFADDLLAGVPDRGVFNRPGDLDGGKLAEKLEQCMGDYPRYLARARDHHLRYDFSTCGSAYVQAFLAQGCVG